jgi:hypothetical protein
MLRVFGLLLLLATPAFAQRTSTLTGCTYDEKKDSTTYFVLPYGSAILPGKWEKEHYNKVSSQQFFTGKDSVNIAIAFVAYDKYEFNPKGKQKGFNFVKAYYEWDSRYMVDAYGLNRKVLERDSIHNFMIYRIYGTIKTSTFDTYFLVGEKKGNASNFSITITDKWTESKKIDFLKNLFLDK